MQSSNPCKEDCDELKPVGRNVARKKPRPKLIDVFAMDRRETNDAFFDHEDVEQGIKSDEGKDQLLPFHLQGDEAFNSKQAVQARESLYTSPMLRQATEQFWALLRKYTYAGEEVIMMTEYCQLMVTIFKALREDFDVQEAMKQAKLDWANDNGKKALFMNAATFHKSLFQLADLWTTDVSEHVYHRFLTILFHRISTHEIEFQNGFVTKIRASDEFHTQVASAVPLDLIQEFQHIQRMSQDVGMPFQSIQDLATCEEGMLDHIKLVYATRHQIGGDKIHARAILSVLQRLRDVDEFQDVDLSCLSSLAEEDERKVHTLLSKYLSRVQLQKEKQTDQALIREELVKLGVADAREMSDAMAKQTYHEFHDLLMEQSVIFLQYQAKEELRNITDVVTKHGYHTHRMTCKEIETIYAELLRDIYQSTSSAIQQRAKEWIQRNAADASPSYLQYVRQNKSEIRDVEDIVALGSHKERGAHNGHKGHEYERDDEEFMQLIAAEDSSSDASDRNEENLIEDMEMGRGPSQPHAFAHHVHKARPKQRSDQKASTTKMQTETETQTQTTAVAGAGALKWMQEETAHVQPKNNTMNTKSTQPKAVYTGSDNPVTLTSNALHVETQVLTPTQANVSMLYEITCPTTHQSYLEQEERVMRAGAGAGANAGAETGVAGREKLWMAKKPSIASKSSDVTHSPLRRREFFKVELAVVAPALPEDMCVAQASALADEWKGAEVPQLWQAPIPSTVKESSKDSLAPTSKKRSILRGRSLVDKEKPIVMSLSGLVMEEPIENVLSTKLQAPSMVAGRPQRRFLLSGLPDTDLGSLSRFITLLRFGESTIEMDPCKLKELLAHATISWSMICFDVGQHVEKAVSILQMIQGITTTAVVILGDLRNQNSISLDSMAHQCHQLGAIHFASHPIDFREFRTCLQAHFDSANVEKRKTPSFSLSKLKSTRVSRWTQFRASNEKLSSTLPSAIKLSSKCHEVNEAEQTKCLTPSARNVFRPVSHSTSALFMFPATRLRK